MAAGHRRRAASPEAQRLLPGIGTGEHARSRGPGCRPRLPPPTARAPVTTVLCGLCRASVLEPRRSWSTRLPVLPAPDRHVSWGRDGGRVQGGASALKGTGHGAREAAPFETARGAWCGAGLGSWTHQSRTPVSRLKEALSRQHRPLLSLSPEPGIMAEKVLVTGGAGYIGSHTVLELLEAGYSPMVIDNFHNAIRGGGSMPESLRRVQDLTGRSVEFEEMDILDQAALQRLFKKHSFMAVIHFAGLKAVGESVQKPLDYYRVNLTGTIQLLEIMRAHGVKNLVFSSSATVYGNPQYLPLDEAHPTGGCTNPYGKSKFFIEEMIRDLCQADKAWNAVLLRYFNPIGAHASGCIGEDPQGIPNNLMPYVSQVAIGRRQVLNVFGNDYDTEDGTGVRDYIHVVDLAKGHIAALRKLKEQCGCRIYNLGTGTGYSVLQMVQAMEKASGKKIPYKVVARREGDVAACYANPSLALKELGWSAALGLDRMCEDLWRWQKQNPSGFGTQA